MTLTESQLLEIRRLSHDRTSGRVKAEHDSSAPECGEYVCLDDGEPGHTELFGTSNSDVVRIEQDDDEDGTYTWDAQGRANMRYVAALWNAGDELVSQALDALDLEKRILSLRSALERIANGAGDAKALAAHELRFDEKVARGQPPF